jgi:pantothenate kinase-related protein Tda10
MARSHLTPVTILEGWRAGSRPIDPEFEQLAFWELTSDLRSHAFNITSENAVDIVRTKADLFLAIIDTAYSRFIKRRDTALPCPGGD